MKLKNHAMLCRITCLSVLACTLIAPHFVLGAEPSESTSQTKRKPAKFLRAENSDILFIEGRELLESPEEILDKMSMGDGTLVADIGCGPGYYSLRLAKRVGPHGLVFAVDIQQGMLDQLAERVQNENATNIYPILGRLDDPCLPPGKIDWVLLVDAYHEFSDPEIMLKRIRDCLAPGGRVALLEYRAEQDPGSLPVPIPRDHKMTIDEVLTEWSAGGFELVSRLEFLPAQHYFIFKKAGAPTKAATTWYSSQKISPVTLGKIPNGSAFGQRVYFGGQPKADDFKACSERGIKTVINLRTPPEMEQIGFDEKGVVREAGMAYVHVPVGRTLLAGDDLRTIMSALENAGRGPVLLHCASSNRVGCVWAMYRSLHHGLSVEDAIREGKAAGMRSPVLEQRARDTIATPWPTPKSDNKNEEKKPG